jgi:hypothetical protein
MIAYKWINLATAPSGETLPLVALRNHLFSSLYGPQSASAQYPETVPLPSQLRLPLCDLILKCPSSRRA